MIKFFLWLLILIVAPLASSIIASFIGANCKYFEDKVIQLLVSIDFALTLLLIWSIL